MGHTDYFLGFSHLSMVGFASQLIVAIPRGIFCDSLSFMWFGFVLSSAGLITSYSYSSLFYVFVSVDCGFYVNLDMVWSGVNKCRLTLYGWSKIWKLKFMNLFVYIMFQSCLNQSICMMLIRVLKLVMCFHIVNKMMNIVASLQRRLSIRDLITSTPVYHSARSTILLLLFCNSGSYTLHCCIWWIIIRFALFRCIWRGIKLNFQALGY